MPASNSLRDSRVIAILRRILSGLLLILAILFLLTVSFGPTVPVRKPPTPGEMIKQKEEARRLEQDKVNTALARVGAFSQMRLDELFAAVQDMRGALSTGELFTAARKPEAFRDENPIGIPEP